MATVLDEIVAGVREDLVGAIATTPLTEVERLAREAAPAVDAEAALRRPGLSLIAEVKRSSPSKGALATIADPAALAADYEAGGATAVSVLTERRRFGGSLADLDAVRRAVRIPVLRKDFMVEDYQLFEARAHGADIILLIVAALEQADLVRMQALARDLGMTALVEVHDEVETARAVDVGASVIGVNARNLKTLAVDPDTFGRLAALIPDTCVKVAESGVSGPADAARYAGEGADAVLVGEALVRGAEPRRAAHDLIAAGAHS
ncbi:indole-3-glycerol phosphate synthase TrpC [Pedococcus sp. 2YAF34]|uniref:indole-3-glycerol phosphate synthase TrpC n=1 Tax=Pedococcus sp. 2YAF34 TaxID=3233032 RepID=UPI003F9D9B8D